MEARDGARQFGVVEAAAYDGFMGRYSRLLAPAFADFADVGPEELVVDLGCGPGALTAELVDRVGPGRVRAVDPSESFVGACAARFPDVDVRRGRAEDVPLPDAAHDRVLAQLVLHFVADPDAAARELVRLLRPGGVAAACVWDFDEGMEMLRLFWDAALRVHPDAPDEARTLRFGRPHEIASLFRDAGLVDVEEAELRVESRYAAFDELWDGFLAGVGPAGGWLVQLPADQREAVRRELVAGLGDPRGPFVLGAVARAARGRRPDS